MNSPAAMCEETESPAESAAPDSAVQLKPQCIAVERLCKRFGSTQALHNVNLSLAAGEVHFLVGENGAGKSTLTRIIAGACAKDSGIIRIDGVVTEMRDVGHARELGICEIYQELMIVPELTVAENVFLGNEKTRFVWRHLDRASMNSAVSLALKKLGSAIHPWGKAGNLPIAQQQIVEIARALMVKSRVIIFDEPTDALTQENAQSLYSVIRGLRQQGISILYITHKLEEVPLIADRVTVLRDGCHVGTFAAGSITTQELIQHMVGRKLSITSQIRASEAAKEPFGEAVAPAEGGSNEVLRVENIARLPSVKPCSFSINAGEIVGIAGLVGSGRTELARCIFGADMPDCGHVLIEGMPVLPGSPHDAVKKGIGFLTEDRKSQGLIMPMHLYENITISALHRFITWGIVDKKKEIAETERHVRDLRIVAAGPQAIVSSLSGGNQQKAVLARWLTGKCRLLIFDEPTRGIDVGAREEIYRLMKSLCEKGTAMLVISSDLGELLSISHRIIIMHRGQIKGIVSRGTAMNEKTIANLMFGKDYND